MPFGPLDLLNLVSNRFVRGGGRLFLETLLATFLETLLHFLFPLLDLGLLLGGQNTKDLIVNGFAFYETLLTQCLEAGLLVGGDRAVTLCLHEVAHLCHY